MIFPLKPFSEEMSNEVQPVDFIGLFTSAPLFISLQVRKTSISNGFI